MPLVLRPPGDAPPLTDRLAGLGRARRAAAVAAGGFRLAAVAVAVAGAACALDAAFHLPAFARAVLLVGTLAAVGVLFLRGVRGPARQSAHPLSVAMLLEDLFPRLNDSLASAVQFLAADPADADRIGSARFRRIAVVRAQNLADRHDLHRIVPAGEAWRAFWLAAVAVTAVSTVGLAHWSRAGVALVRFADPFGRHPWPTATAIDFVEPAKFPARLAKGDPFELKFALRGLIPDRAIVHVRLADGPQTEDAVALTVADPKAPSVPAHLRLDPGRVPRDFEVRVTAHDADTGWLAVSVAPPPVLVPLDGRPSPQIRLEYPAYTDLPAVELPPGAGAVEAVTGTRIALRVAADRPIAAAVVRPLFDLVPYRAAAAAAGLAGFDPISALAAHALVAEASADVPVRVSGPDRTRLEVEFAPRLPGLYALRFTDDTGLTGTRLLELRMFGDPAPAVALHVGTEGIEGRDSGPLVLLSTASFPLRMWAEDRTFAVKDAVLEYRGGGPDAPFRCLPLVDLAAAGETAPGVIGAAVEPLRVKPSGIGAIRTIPLAQLLKADGSAPADGDLITLRAAAADWDDIDRLKAPGRSREVEIRVVSKTGLEALFQDELAKLRPELLRAREEQRAAREAVAEVAKAAADGKPTPDDVAKLGRAEQVQRELGQRIADPAEGLRAKADRLRQAAWTNPAAKSAAADRVEAVADDLARLADGQLDAAEPAVAAAKREAENASADPKKLAAAADKAAREQKAVEDALDAVLERLEQWGGAGEVRGQARGLKEQLNRAGAESAKAVDRVPDGKSPDQLTPREKQDLEGPAGKLDELAKQTGGLLDKAGRMADEKEKQAAALAETADDLERMAAAAGEQAAGPEAAANRKAAAEKLRGEAAGLRKAADAAKAEADALRQAVREAGGEALPNDLRSSADSLRQNQPGNAAAGRASAANRLDRLADALSERKTEDAADELRKRRKDAADDANALAEAQDELQKKAREAGDIADPKQREEAFQKLAREQDRLRERAEQLAERLTRDREPQPAAAVKQAADKMAEAQDALERGQPPTEPQDEALDRLDEALDKLEAKEQQAEERLSREQREQLAEQLKAIRDRQAAVVAEAGRIHDAVVQAKGWSRGHLRSYADLDPAEAALAEELRGFTDKQLGELPVFKRLAAQAAAAMDRAARKAAERAADAVPDDPFDAEVEAAGNDRVRGPMTVALRRLDQILGAIQEEPKPAGEQQAGGAPGGEGAGGEGGGGGDENAGGGGVPQLAQLKALRAVQAEVNERTAAFAKVHPDPAKLTDDDKDELKELEQTQREIAELFDELAPALRAGPQ